MVLTANTKANATSRKGNHSVNGQLIAIATPCTTRTASVYAGTLPQPTAFSQTSRIPAPYAAMAGMDMSHHTTSALATHRRFWLQRIILPLKASGLMSSQGRFGRSI